MNPGRSAAVSRSYSFSNVTAPFSGAIEFKYRDEELNGIIEDELILNILNGTSWFAYSDNLKNAASNIIFTSSLVTVPPGEMALSSALAVLPVKWSHLNVWRSGRTVKIDWGTHQEYDVSHFIVQKSSNGQNWVTVGPVIPARNTNTLQTYQLTDFDYSPQQLFYRVQETGRDGQKSYSLVQKVNEDRIPNSLSLFPNPVANSFYIQTSDPNRIKSVQVYNVRGALVKSWSGGYHSYSVAQLPAGTYSVVITHQDGITEKHTIIKPQNQSSNLHKNTVI